MAEEAAATGWGMIGAYAAGAVAAVGIGGYIAANAPALHRGASGYGSCSTAIDIIESKDADVSGKICIVTGANSGIGTETAKALALGGAHVIVPCRSMAKAEATIATIKEACAAKGVKAALTPAVLDLGDLESVAQFVATVKGMGLDKIDIIVCNAGIMALPKREETKQGIEKQVGVCHVGHFLLVTSLIDLLKAAGTARVVMVSSVAHGRARDTAWTKSPTMDSPEYRPWSAYGNAKMSNVLFAKELNERYASEGVTAYSLHPGGIHTNLQTHVRWKTMLFWIVVSPFFFKSVPQGAATSVFCAAHAKAEAGAGGYFEDCNLSSAKHDDWINTEGVRVQLWDTTEDIVKAFRR